MNPPDELKALTEQFYEAVATGNVAFMNSYISTQPNLLLIGSDPCEWWTSTTAMLPTLEAQAGAGITVVPGDIQASVEGTIGWVASRGAFVLRDGDQVAFRFTGVFHQEEGAWKLIQGHVSMGVPNREALETDLAI